MITPGHNYELSVVKALHFGFYLDAGDMGQVLLPLRYAPNHLAVGDTIEVFLYLDSEDRPIATTEKPKARVGEFAYLKVVATTTIGAFLDWGLSKDLFVPASEQHRPMEEGQHYLVYLYLDQFDGRIVASSKIDTFLDDDRPHDFSPQQAVDLIITNSTDIGYKAIINHTHWGVLHSSDVHQRLSFGQSIRGYIKRVRPDGKIDLSLQSGQESRDRNQQDIEEKLRQQGGFLALHDKSEPALIKEELGMSKAAFKKAIGALYKDRKITIAEDGIRSAENPQAGSAEPVKNKPGKGVQKDPQAAPSAKETVVEISSEPVELYKILKFEGLAGSGGEAKTAVAEGLVRVNGEVETQKRKKIMGGDLISFAGESLRVQVQDAAKPEASRPASGPWSGTGSKTDQ